MDELPTIETFVKADELMRICRTAVRKATENNRRLGVGNVYWFNGIRYFELANGDLTRTPPQTSSDAPLTPSK